MTGPRLAFLIPSMAGGGAERVFVNLANELAGRGIAVDLVLGRATGEHLEKVDHRIRLIELGADRIVRMAIPLLRYLRRERPLAVISALEPVNLVNVAACRASLTGARPVVTIHSDLRMVMRNLTHQRARVVPFAAGRLYPFAHAVVAVSSGVADGLAETSGLRRSRIDVAANPVVTDEVEQGRTRAPAHPWLVDRSSPVVAAFGRLAPSKNIGLMLDAVATIEGLRLIVFGDGPERAVLESHRDRLGLVDRVDFPGFVSNPYAEMAAADVVALSSDWEGLPTVLIEALACGTPVVSTDCPSGPSEILRAGELGRLTPVGDVAAFADAIRGALRDGPPDASLDDYRPRAAADRYLSLIGWPG